MEEYNYLKSQTWGNIQDNEGKELNHIEKLDWLREKINILNMEIISKINRLLYNSELSLESQHSIDECRKIVKQHLCEARFWLGWELSRLRDANNTR